MIPSTDTARWLEDLGWAIWMGNGMGDQRQLLGFHGQRVAGFWLAVFGERHGLGDFHGRLLESRIWTTGVEL